ncbi:type IV pilus biogenesis/stability protein PilW [Massilia sp. CCM 8734]|uniref:type IV pilus biogenesis/stability protein PilW n=1 Tax=Massilia sp. CCM 8734 TaxID=2609283 RepID=UPI001AAF3704|nr:type IV pilus biogenesis/stability protein PilW [Massilia sp. CCM 8734]
MNARVTPGAHPRRLLALALVAGFAAALGACTTTTVTRNASAEEAGLQGSTTELKTASDQTNKDKRAAIRMQLAIGYYQEGNYGVALDEIKQAIAIDPEMADAYSVRALIYTSMGENILAEENYQRAMRLAPRNPELNNNYGSFLCQTERFAPAIAQFEIALKNPMYQSPVKALVNAGGCSIKQKNYDAAERYLLQALRIEADLLPVQAGLARVYYERRDYVRAGVYINRVKAVAKLDSLPADVLWLAIRVERKLGEKESETSLATQLRRRHPGSPEFAAFQRGAFDE